MQVRKLAVAGVVAIASWTALGLASPALALCDSYSGGCATTPPTSGGGDGIGGTDEQPVTGTDEQPVTGTDEQPVTGTDEQPVTGVDEEPTNSTEGGTPVRGNSGGPGAGVSPTPTSLPFTGGELVLMTAVGVGALAGGTALVLAGRRRTATA